MRQRLMHFSKLSLLYYLKRNEAIACQNNSCCSYERKLVYLLRTTKLSIEEKREKFNSFFLIAHPININIVPLSAEDACCSFEEFQSNMPYAFKIAGEMAEVQSQALKPLRNLGEKLDDLVNYLQFQAQKIDLMMSYILQQQDAEEYRANAVKFGGGGTVVEYSSAQDIGKAFELKLFLDSESAAVYAYGEVIDCERIEADKYLISLVFTHLRDQDQELLVRASLHLQTHALRKNKP